MGWGGWDSGGKCEGVSLKLTVMPVQQLQVHEKKNCFSFFKKKLSVLRGPSEVGRRLCF